MVRSLPTAECELAFLEAGYRVVAGVDEVGRGALAGPVVAGCVVVRPESLADLGRIVRDSKMMSARQRDHALPAIQELAAAVAIGIVPPVDIDRFGIGPANRLALEQAVHGLDVTPDALICDAFVIEHSAPQVALIDGDARSISVAAASIVAKVMRDRMMVELSDVRPGYGFERHVGYGTRVHLEALRSLGPCPEHRRSFAPVRQLIEAGWPL